MELKNKQIITETTNICDAHCVICPRESFKQKPHTMSLDLFKKIIDDAASHGVNSLDTCGFGEFFLDKHNFKRLKYAKEKIPNLSVFISTTGFHMDPDTWENVAEYIDILKLSIYGATKETYEAFHRGKVKYDQSMANINGFLEFAKGRDKKPHTIGLLVRTDLNRHEELKWLGTWRPKLDEVFIWEPHNWVDGRKYRKVMKSRQATCGRPEGGPLYIHADGTVSPCCWDIHKRIPLGNLNTQTIEEIYRSAPYIKLRRAHKVADFSGYICNFCDQTNYNPDVLVYASNDSRKVGQITSNQAEIVGAS